MFDPQPGFDFRSIGSWEPQFSTFADYSDWKCGHSGKLDRGSLIGRYGEGLLIGDLKRMLCCRMCGSKRVRVLFSWNINYQERVGSAAVRPVATVPAS